MTILLTSFIFELSIETHLSGLYGLEKKQDMTSSYLAEPYWPSRIGRVASVLAELPCIGRVCHSYDSDCFCHVHTILLIVN